MIITIVFTNKLSRRRIGRAGKRWEAFGIEGDIKACVAANQRGVKAINYDLEKGLAYLDEISKSSFGLRDVIFLCLWKKMDTGVGQKNHC